MNKNHVAIPSYTIVSVERLIIDFLSKQLSEFPWYPLGNNVGIFVTILTHLTPRKEVTKNEVKIVVLPAM